MLTSVCLHSLANRQCPFWVQPMFLTYGSEDDFDTRWGDGQDASGRARATQKELGPCRDGSGPVGQTMSSQTNQLPAYKTVAQDESGPKNRFCLIRRHLEANLSILGQMLQQYCDGEFNYRSNAVFGFIAAITVPDIMELFRNDARQLRKRHFWPLEATILTLVSFTKNKSPAVIIFLS